MTKFTCQISGSGKEIFQHIENGKKRDQLIEDALKGKITQEEMRKQSKKIKYLFFREDLPDDVEIITQEKT